MTDDVYRLARPDVASALHALRRGVGAARAERIWAEEAPSAACDLGPRALLKVAERIAARQGLESIVGLSLQIRCETWLALYGDEHGD